MIVQPGRRYSGLLHKEVHFTTTATCRPGGTFDRPDVGSIDLQIEGTLPDGLRMQGTMAPATHDLATFEGSWDFAPVMP